MLVAASQAAGYGEVELEKTATTTGSEAAFSLGDRTLHC
jgi:hypothetical protein